MPERLNNTLMENLITLLAYDDEQGKMLAHMLDPALFEGEYRIIAERCIDYWHKHQQAPKNHTPDLVGDIIDDPHNRKAPTYRRIMSSMVELSGSINTAYVLDQLRTFTRLQRLKDAILRSAEQLNSQQEMAISEVESIWNSLLRDMREVSFAPGIRLTDIDRVLTYLEVQQSEFTMGIRELDQRHVVPARGTAVLLLGATGRGKSWFLVNTGKQALMQRMKVLHVTLEMSEEQVAQRYYQSLFSATKRNMDVEITTLGLNSLGRLDELIGETVHPDFTFDSAMVRDELELRLAHVGGRFSNLLIKRFPTRSLTIDGLIAFLDNIEITEHFIPDMVILDYLGIVHTTDTKDHRISLGQWFMDFRGLMISRNMAGVTAQQSSKIGAFARSINLGHVAEDWSLTNTADIVLMYSSTDAEARLGLGRLYVGKARDEEDKFGVLMTQNYQMGQFVLDSMMLDSKYWDLMAEFTGDDEKDEDDA